MQAVNSKMLEHLECPICNELLSAPIKQCLTGHSFCNECASQMKCCPQCRANFSTVRNVTLEVVIKNVLISCSSCNEKMIITDLPYHKSLCHLENTKCKIPLCTWNGPRCNMWNHIDESHFNDLHENGSTYYGGYEITGTLIDVSEDENYALIKEVVFDNKVSLVAQLLLPQDIDIYKLTCTIELLSKDNEKIHYSQPCLTHEIDADSLEVIKKKLISVDKDYYNNEIASVQITICNS